MASIRIQAGHVNIENNCDWGLRGETGAPGEREYTSEIAGMVAGALEAHGHDVAVWDANANCNGNLVGRDYDAVIALHCDGRDQSGFAVGVGNPNEDGAATASEHLRESLRSAYSASTSLPDIDDLGSDTNVLEYYLFRVLTPATPFVLIEMGAIASAEGGPGPDENYLYSNASNVASGIVNGVLAFVPEITTPEPEPTPETTPTPEPTPQPSPEVTPPPLVGPPPALIPPPNIPVPAILTNLGQAIAYEEQLQAAVKLYVNAVLTELHTARRLLGGE